MASRRLTSVEIAHVTPPSSPEALATYLRENLMASPPSRLTRSVEAWATENNVKGDDRELLERYREAYEHTRHSLLVELEAATAAGPTRLAAIAVLNRTGITDAERIIVLQALDGTVGRSEIGPIVSAVMKQRPAVARRTAIISQVHSGESLFALNKVLGLRNDEAGETARQLGVDDEGADSADARDAPSTRSIDAGTYHRDRHRERRARRCRPRRRPRAQESGRTTQGLSDYQQLVRDELHLFALLIGTPGDDELGKRARETLFTRTPLDRVRSAAPLLPTDVLSMYCERSLSRINRRKRIDRAGLLSSFSRPPRTRFARRV